MRREGHSSGLVIIIIHDYAVLLLIIFTHVLISIQLVLEQCSIDNPLNLYVVLIQLSFHTSVFN